MNKPLRIQTAKEIAHQISVRKARAGFIDTRAKEEEVATVMGAFIDTYLEYPEEDELEILEICYNALIDAEINHYKAPIAFLIAMIRHLKPVALKDPYDALYYVPMAASGADTSVNVRTR